jgi:hypothetical protein
MGHELEKARHSRERYRSSSSLQRARSRKLWHLPRIGGCYNHAGSQSLKSTAFQRSSTLISWKIQFRPCLLLRFCADQSTFYVSIVPSIIGLPINRSGNTGETGKGTTPVSPQDCLPPPTQSTLAPVIYSLVRRARRLETFFPLDLPESELFPLRWLRPPMNQDAGPGRSKSAVFRSLHHLRHVLGPHALSC